MRILDAYCGGGGAARGYALAGFEVVGVDKKPQPDYPYEFHQGDALEFIEAHGHEFDAHHTSPPCQPYSTLTSGTNGGRTGETALIDATRTLLERTGKPYVIENVKGSTLRKDLMLCGVMFDLRVYRHRYFEVGGFRTRQPQHYKHPTRVADWRHGLKREGLYFAVYGTGGSRGTLTEWQDAMGIDWITSKDTLAEAIPPMYTRLIGQRLMATLRVRAVTAQHPDQ